MAIFITRQDYIKTNAAWILSAGKDAILVAATGVKPKEEDDLQHFFIANMHDRLLVFTDHGQVYSLEVMDLPEGGKTARGLALVNLLSIRQDETVTACYSCCFL